MERLDEIKACEANNGSSKLGEPRLLRVSAPISHKIVRAIVRPIFKLIVALSRKNNEGAPLEARIIFKLASLGPNPQTISLSLLRRLYRIMTIPFHMDAPTMARIAEYDVTPDLMIRLYYPQNIPSPAPGLLYFHGGGLIIGDLETHDTLCRVIADQSRVVVASVAYRLAPESAFPAQLIDTRNTCMWMCNNSEALGIDPMRTGIGGDSAGAYLAILLALSRIGMTPAPHYLALIYPFLDPQQRSSSASAFGDGYLLNKKLMKRFTTLLDNGDLDLNSLAINPLQHPDIRNLPQSLVVTCEFDPLRDEGRAFVDRIKDRDGKITHIHESRLYHEFISNGGVVAEARNAIDKITMWIKSRAYS